jgi:hypothetical protein
MPHTCKLLKLISYENRLLQHVTIHDEEVGCRLFISADNKMSTAKISFGAEAIFHVSGNVNRHN